MTVDNTCVPIADEIRRNHLAGLGVIYLPLHGGIERTISQKVTDRFPSGRFFYC